jgi:hypothetical protein
MFTRTERRNRDRVEPKKATPVKILSAVKAGSVITITFDQVVSLRGTPLYTTDLAGVIAASATMPTPTTLAVTFSAAITTATEINVPFEDPAVRSTTGGFVATSTFPLA